MPKWSKPEELLPDESVGFYVGDRIIGIVNERNPKTLRMERRAIILECTENGWHCADDTYAGYTIADCEYWATEKDLVMFAKVMEM